MRSFGRTDGRQLQKVSDDNHPLRRQATGDEHRGGGSHAGFVDDDRVESGVVEERREIAAGERGRHDPALTDQALFGVPDGLFFLLQRLKQLHPFLDLQRPDGQERVPIPAPRIPGNRRGEGRQFGLGLGETLIQFSPDPLQLAERILIVLLPLRERHMLFEQRFARRGLKQPNHGGHRFALGDAVQDVAECLLPFRDGRGEQLLLPDIDGQSVFQRMHPRDGGVMGAQNLQERVCGGQILLEGVNLFQQVLSTGIRGHGLFEHQGIERSELHAVRAVLARGAEPDEGAGGERGVPFERGFDDQVDRGIGLRDDEGPFAGAGEAMAQFGD